MASPSKQFHSKSQEKLWELRNLRLEDHSSDDRPVSSDGDESRLIEVSSSAPETSVDYSKVPLDQLRRSARSLDPTLPKNVSRAICVNVLKRKDTVQPPPVLEV